ncbi:Leucine-rich repeat-containing protein 57 [Halotydeus destructor]|nr:Leucine-rich repeat-containing protein 57 [Halotydeus destructor]
MESFSQKLTSFTNLFGKKKTLKNHLQNAEKTGVFQLSQSSLSEVPSDVLNLKDSCRSLDLSKNKIRTIPSDIGAFCHLRVLNLNDNRLNSIPEQIGNLKSLKTLSLNGNAISAIPTTLNRLESLEVLAIVDNKLTEFPVCIIALKNLITLDLSGNQITEIPDGVDQLRVTELNLDRNRLARISESISQCSKLRTLRLEENCLQLTAIPEKLLTESQVSLITVTGNVFNMREFHKLPGYEKYDERFAAVKKKMAY